MKKILPLLILLMTLISCTEDNVDYVLKNEQEIQAYLSENNIDAVPTGTGLYYYEVTEGEGPQATSSSTVSIRYTGYFLDGNIFDQNVEEPITLDLDYTIEGFSEGIGLMKEGGSATLFIPSHLGYGSLPFNGIPGGSVLIFDVNLDEIISE